MARETIVLFFLEIWPIFKARFGGEIIASQISAKDEKWKLSTTRSLRVTFYTQFPKIRVYLLVNFCMQFLHACFARVLLLWFACNTADLHGRKCIRVMLQFPWSVLQIIIYSDIPLEWISHSRNYKGNGLKLSAQRFLESFGWTWALLMIGR